MNPDKKNEFDRQLAGKFENFRPEVPGGLWDKIAATLDKQEQDNVIPIKHQRRFPTWWISVAASALLVCGIVYWYNRPVTVTYLQNPVVQHEEQADAPVIEEPVVEPGPVIEPVDVDRLKQLFARRNRKTKSENQPETQVAEPQHIDRPAEGIDSPLLIADRTISPEDPLATNDGSATSSSAGRPAIGEAVAATIPDIQPPVVLEEDEETLLAATEEPKPPFGISNILNYVVGTVDQRDEKLVTFSNDGEGSLKLDFNFGLAKNKKSKIK